MVLCFGKHFFFLFSYIFCFFFFREPDFLFLSVSLDSPWDFHDTSIGSLGFMVWRG
jgi:hypothetical protein